MPAEAVLAAGSFVGFLVLWVVLPSVIRRKAENKD